MVYFIGCLENKVVKIGYSKNVENRLTQLQTGYPTKLSVFKVLDGDTDDEKFYHEYFSSYRIGGEWFELSDELRKFLNLEEQGFKIYDFTKLFIIKSAIDIKFMFLLAKYVKYNTNICNLTTVCRDEIKYTLGIENSQISRSLKSLKDKGLITVNKDEISINPAVFWKGTNETRNKMLKENKLEIKLKFCYHCGNENKQEENNAPLS